MVGLIKSNVFIDQSISGPQEENYDIVLSIELIEPTVIVYGRVPG